MKNSLIVISLISLPFFYPVDIAARDNGGLKPTFKAEKKELKEEFRDKMEELKEGVKEKIDDFKSQSARIIGGEVTAVSGTSLTVSQGGKTYTVNTDAKTHFQRHFWGKSALEEFSTGDKVNVHGKFTDDAKTTILARLVRNLSIMKRRGVFIGDVKSKGTSSFVITSKQRGDQTVYFDSKTKFVQVNEKVMAFADLQVGHRVRVKGVWDKTLKEIREVVQVKDYSLPPRTTKSPKPSKSITPTGTISPTLTNTPTLTPTATSTPTPTP